MPSIKNTPKPLIIDDETLTDPRIKDIVFCPVIEGDLKGHGLVPRDYSIHPREMFDPPSNMELIPDSEVDGRIEDQEKHKSSLEHLRDRAVDGQPFPSLDQNGDGYCWAYSTGACMILLRLVAKMPYVRFNPHATAAIIKRGRNEGGWCGLSAKWSREVGYAADSHWPGHSRDLKNDTPALRANMALYRCLEDWVDLARDVYDQNLTIQQVRTCMLLNLPCAVDFNWWGHSVCAIRWVKVEAGSYGLKILNSWTDQWGERGTSVLRGSKMVPDGAISLRVITPTVASPSNTMTGLMSSVEKTKPKRSHSRRKAA